MSSILRRIREQSNSAALLAGTVVLGLAVAGYLLAQERIQWPSWLPVLGQSYYTLDAPVSAVSGVLPGQGQAVTIAGVNVGQITGVRHGTNEPVITMRLDGKYGSRVYSNATVLLRPKTGLQDMVAELDPGSAAAGHHLHSGSELAPANTLPTVNFDELLSQLDSDTRAELTSLVSNAGVALSGNGANLSATLRDFAPLAVDVRASSALLVQRNRELRRLFGNLAAISTTLGDNETELTRFIRGNAGVWRAFAAQNRQLRSTLALLPAGLRNTNTALTKFAGLGTQLRQTFTRLQPATSNLASGLRAIEPFLRDTTPVLKNQLRPFSTAAQPTARLLAPAAQGLARSTPDLTTLATELNAIVDELAYKPPHGQGYLFYVPWANHDTNSAISSQDGGRPVRQSLLLFNCGTLNVSRNYFAHPAQNPTLATLLRLVDLPSSSQHCTDSGLPK